ncbi:hypothetical protein SAMN03080614_104819 [Anaerobranca gottschalkii DSM 13577]|uniref:Uncharacterized protein n=2 Tax=Anaerobranca gottschalkii TaxID=108328 RepID=A0A1I0BT33_9FIRM|nr:hypothetical protein SAMN03080614_104819 [Anaerobranca gottschalkii DSM 13577]
MFEIEEFIQRVKIMKKNSYSIYIFNLIILILFAEALYSIITGRGIDNKIILTSLLFLGVKIFHDILTYVIYRKKLFSYLEDYFKEIFITILISIMAGGIAWITEIILNGNVKTTIFAVITSVYLKSN